MTAFRLAAVAGLAALMAGSARADALSAAAAAATVAVQAVEPTGDGRARVSECSGTLIAPDVVLTAGHCLDLATGPSRVAVFAYRDGRPVPSPLAVAALARHPDYVAGWRSRPGDPETRQREIAADLALIRLTSPIPGARPLPLARLSGVSGALAGTGGAGPGARSGAMKRIALSAIRASTGSGATVAFATASAAVCDGDSGGPAVASAPDGAAVAWGIAAAVLRPRGGCGTRIAVAPVDPASAAFRAMQATLGGR